MMRIQADPAVVYRGGGRRYLTLLAACTAEARWKIKSNCLCDYVDHEGWGREHLPCSYHDGSDHAEKMLRRLARLYMRAYRTSAGKGE